MSWAGLVLSGWLEAALAAGESFEAFEKRGKPPPTRQGRFPA